MEAGKPSVPTQFLLELKEYQQELESQRDDLDAVEDKTIEQAEEVSRLDDEIEDVESLIDTLECF